MQNEESLQITVEVSTEEPEIAEEIDVALAGEVRTELRTQLEQDGFSVSLEKTEVQQKGGPVLFLVLIGIGTHIVQFADMVWQQRHGIDEIIQDLGILYVICEKAVHIARRITQIHKKKTPARTADDQACKITIEVDGVPVTLNPKDLAEQNAALLLAQKIAQLAPEKARQVNVQSQVRVQGKLPKRNRRKHKGRR